jgi:hypothetical protein
VSADVQIRDEDSTLIVSVTNIRDKIASLTTRIELPLSKIESVSTEPPKIDRWRTVKTFATVVPSYYAGRFYEIGKGKEFFLFSNKNRCITLNLKNFKFRRVIVEVSNKQAVADMIRNRLG